MSYVRTADLSGGLGLAPIIASAISALSPKKIFQSVFGETEAYRQRLAASKKAYALLNQLREVIKAGELPPFVVPLALLSEALNKERMDLKHDADWRLMRIENDLRLIREALATGVATIPLRFIPYLERLGIPIRGPGDQVYRRAETPVIPPVIIPKVVPPVLPVADLPVAIQPEAYVPDLPGPPLTAAIVPTDMFARKIFGIPMPIALGGAAVLLYLVTRK